MSGVTDHVEQQKQSTKRGEVSGEHEVRRVFTAAKYAFVFARDFWSGCFSRGRGRRRRQEQRRRGQRRRGQRAGEARIAVDSGWGECDETRLAAPGVVADPFLVPGDASVDPGFADQTAVVAKAHDATLDPDASVVFDHERTPWVTLHAATH